MDVIKDMIVKIRNATFSTWRDSVLILVLATGNWLIYGKILGFEFYDNHLAFAKVLTDRGDVLAYMSIIFAIQIPLFILLLEKMLNAGNIRRLILPSVIQFREILISYVTFSLLILISPALSYLYFPLAMITYISVFTVYEAIKVMFEPYKLKDREERYLRRVLSQVLERGLRFRINTNDFFQQLDGHEHITHALQDIIGYDVPDKQFKILAKQDGIVKFVDLAKMEDLMKNNFTSVRNYKSHSKEKDKSLESESKIPKLILQIQPGLSIKAQAEIMHLLIPAGYNEPSRRLLERLKRCIDLNPDHPDSKSRLLDNILKDYKTQLYHAVEMDDEVALEVPLNYSKLINSELQKFSANNISQDINYKFQNARAEFRTFYSDDVSSRLQDITEIFNDAILRAIQNKKQVTAGKLISAAYDEVYRATEKYSVLAAAIADQALIFPVLRLLNTKDNMIVDMQFKDEAIGMIMFRLKEHTSLSLYKSRYREGQIDITKEQLCEWMTIRLEDCRNLLLLSYKNSDYEVFTQTLQILNEFEEDYKHHTEKIEDLVLLARCNLFIVGAYCYDRNGETEIQSKCRMSVATELEKFDSRIFTEMLVTCVDKGYAEKWRVDTYDLVADGRMHSVPDFTLGMRLLWATLMMNNGVPTTDINYYGDTMIAKTITFTDGLSKDQDASLLKYLNDKSDDVNSTELKKLVQMFIDHRREYEKNTLIDRPLSTTKIYTFRKDIIKGYKENALVAKLFQKAKAVYFNQKTITGFMSLGWNQVFDKEAFIEKWHIGTYLQGDEHGREIANKQNQIITSKMLENRVIVESIDDWLTELKRDKKTQWAIFTVEIGTWYLRHHFPKFITRNNERKFKGVNQIMPIEFIYNDTLPKGLYAIRTKDIGKLFTSESKPTPVDVKVDAYSHDSVLLNAILKSPPEWLNEKGNKADQESFLKTKVRMFINHAYKYEPSDTRVAYYFPIKREY